uniref:Protein kinase domain-containing protein n=1 Tax=Globodera rostochiensis TaxID=31243 RepID=A0A914GUB1_GLORO
MAKSGHEPSRVTRNPKTLVVDKVTEAAESTKRDAKELEDYLTALSPFNKRWTVERTLSSGSYGVVFLCRDFIHGYKGVVKVARHGSGHETASWEAYIMKRLTDVKKKLNIVELLDQGVLVDHHNNQLDFMVLEFCEIPVKKYLGSKVYGPGRKALVCQVLLGALKGICELHQHGLLHRDLKPDNMGIKSLKEPVTLLYDLGMTRMFTDSHGALRPPRTVVSFKGTVEWASGHAVKGREQTRWDDLVAWMYIAVELFDPDLTSETPYPWDANIRNTKAIRYLKSTYAPANLLLKHSPRQFYSIHTYLMCANRLMVPNYAFIANKVAEAMNECKMEASRQTTPSPSTNVKAGQQQTSAPVDTNKPAVQTPAVIDIKPPAGKSVVTVATSKAPAVSGVKTTTGTAVTTMGGKSVAGSGATTMGGKSVAGSGATTMGGKSVAGPGVSTMGGKTVVSTMGSKTAVDDDDLSTSSSSAASSAEGSSSTGGSSMSRTSSSSDSH